MKKSTQLKWNQLKMSYPYTDFNFDTTEQFEAQESLKEELETLEFGLKIDARGYNVYVSGVDEESMLEYVMAKVEEQARKQPIPMDLCYIHNFKYPSMPRLVRMIAGEGIQLKNDMIEFKHFIINELATKLESYDIEKKKKKILSKLEADKEEIVKELEEQSWEVGFSVQLTQDGMAFNPINLQGETITIEEYESLNKEREDEATQQLEMLYALAEDKIREVEELEKYYAMKLADIDEEVVLKEVARMMSILQKRYQNYHELQNYFDWIIEDIEDNIGLFITTEKQESQGILELFPWMSQKGPEEIVGRYEVNLIVNHCETKHAPVIQATHLGYNHLIGSIKVDNELSTNHIDYRNIYSGILHEVNGGYLVIKMSDLVEYPGAWEVIKRVLKTESITIENLVDATVALTTGIMPETLPAKIKVILIGSYELYTTLLEYDRTFKDYFKINVDFQEIIENNKEAIEEFIGQIKRFCEREKLPPITSKGIVKLLEMSHREAESQVKISSNMQPIYDTIREASLFVEDRITHDAIESSKKIKEIFKRTLQRSVEERYDKNFLMVDTVGKKVGQINGLAVYEINNYRFGKPARITATTYRGKSGIIDLETEVGLSGSIHSKGIQIITGFLGSQYAKEFPLALSCRICFEQSYGGIDGDSASAAELFVVLSSLAEVPLRQGIAVTGSINQHGEIQPIGGVNDKIEGFYKICKKKGLTGNQGVIIPYQNKEDLMLEDEVVEAVKEGKFHIYAIQNFKQGIQLLTDTSYKKLHQIILEKLRQYAQIKEE